MPAALLLAAAFAASPTSASVVASPDRAGARPVVLTVSLHALLECGRLQARTIVIDLPPAVHVPGRIPAAAVRVGNAQSRSVTVGSHRLRIRQRVTTGPVCASLTFGRATIVFDRRAGIGNPSSPGQYAIGVHLGRRSVQATLHIRA